MKIPQFALTAGVFFALQAWAVAALAADYAREQRWADEVVPGVVVGEAVDLHAQGRKFLGLYTEAQPAKAGVIVVHGMGIHPDWGLIGVLRAQLSERGYTTLSIQMPVLANEAKPTDYPKTFPEARARLAAAVKYLKDKNQQRIAIVSHSMGARMSNMYLTQGADPAVKAWVAIGIPAFDAAKKIKVPTLDLFGENDFPQVLKGAAARAQALRPVAGSRQLKVPQADHFFEGQDAALVEAVAEFLDGSVGAGKSGQ